MVKGYGSYPLTPEVRFLSLVFCSDGGIGIRDRLKICFLRVQVPVRVSPPQVVRYEKPSYAVTDGSACGKEPGSVVQLVKTPPFQGGNGEFKSPRSHFLCDKNFSNGEY